MKICLIDAGIFIDKPELLAPLEEKNQVTVFSGIPDSVEEVVQRGSDADVIAFGLMQFTNEMIDRLPNLKVLQFIGTGVWNFEDVDNAQRDVYKRQLYIQRPAVKRSERSKLSSITHTE